MLKQKRKTQHTHSLGRGLLRSCEAGGKTAMVGALADFGRSTVAAVRARHSQGSGNYYQNNSYKSMTGEREGTFLYVKVSLHAANQALWRAVA